MPSATPPPNPAQLMRIVRRLAATQSWDHTKHALERMAQRGFDDRHIRSVLLLGEIAGPPEPAQRKGDWRIKVVGAMDRGNRKIGVMTVVMRAERLLIVTTEWEDR